MLEDLEKELAAWRAKKGKPEAPPSRRRASSEGAPSAGPKVRRTVNINGREIVIVKKAKK